jgi:anti-sigma B factor antagonist
MVQEAGDPDFVVREGPSPTTRIVEFRDTFLNYERTDEMRPRLKQLIAREMEGGCRRIILDLCNVGVVDSCGLATLVSINKQIAIAEGTLALFGLSDMILRLLELTRLDRVFEVHATEDEAAAASGT